MFITMKIASSTLQIALVALLSAANGTTFAFVVHPQRPFLTTRRHNQNMMMMSSSVVLSEGADSNFEGMMNSARDAFSDAASGAMEAASTTTSGSGGGNDASTSADMMASFPPEIAIAAGAIAVLGIGAAVFASSSSSSSSGSSESATKEKKEAPQKKKKEAPKPDVSIPYDAAARLAYQSWLSKQKEGTKDSEAVFQQFKELYEEAVVMKVTAKKLEKDLENFDPNKPKPKPRPVAAAKKEEDAAVNGDGTNGATATTKDSKDAETPFFANS